MLFISIRVLWRSLYRRGDRINRSLRCLLTLSLLVSAVAPAQAATGFVHPGLLHTQADFERIKNQLANDAEPWKSGWNKLISNNHASLNWKANPVEIVYRGANSEGAENYGRLYNDAAAAYALALRWKLSGDVAYADKAVEILNAWSSTLKDIRGTSDRYLAAGIYGYELANAAELVRDYRGWKQADFNRFSTMMLKVFYPLCHDFLVRHNNARIDHYWSNWDLAQLNTILAIGVLTDNRDIYNEAIGYFKTGSGNGAINNLVWKLYPETNVGQMQESGRDQGHATLAVGLVGSLAQMAWSQGDDLFGYADNRILKGAEYVAAYNLGKDVPYTTYSNSDGIVQTVISPTGRGTLRPTWEMLYNHYVVLKKLNAPNIKAFAEKVRVEGGGGDYGPNSGGFDHLGYGTLMYTLVQ
ncbi:MULTISPECIES: alginate lyase family protein [Dickeya]|uniref:alginate lyase family protein n=1 Tax=Dickeya TaxID=204037 RepID=UPI0003A60C75|nr:MULTISPECIES: alginate lyase family protein [Dickeya]AYH48486.1 cell wall anchor protein [Dickeya fangzhongdai]UGA49398.1 alginate lyase family protein [Dickeya fangzhongdai]UWH05752.1 alginate lyase family protein [Dickeya fangzhongdai]